MNDKDKKKNWPAKFCKNKLQQLVNSKLTCESKQNQNQKKIKKRLVQVFYFFKVGSIFLKKKVLKYSEGCEAKGGELPSH